MNTTVAMDGKDETLMKKPGASLASVREQKGYSLEYVAGKLHLRVRIMELLEADEYHSMPEPVFIKGYLRAYAKLLEVSAEPLLETFNRMYTPERKLEKALWQSKRETNKIEHIIRWLTGLFAVIVTVAVVLWWHNNQENEQLFPKNVSSNAAQHNQSDTEIRLTDLSKMRSLLSSNSSTTVIEEQ